MACIMFGPMSTNYTTTIQVPRNSKGVLGALHYLEGSIKVPNPGQLDTGQLDTGHLDTGHLDTGQLDTHENGKVGQLDTSI